MGVLDAPALSRVLADNRYANIKKLRARDTFSRGTGKIPGVMASPPTVTSRTVSWPLTTGSAISGAVLRMADSPDFAYRGAKPGFTIWGGSIPTVVSSSYTSGQTTQPPYLVAFLVRSAAGVLEVVTKNGTGTGCRVLIDGQYVTFPDATILNTTNDGGGKAYSLTIGTGWHDIEIEASAGATFAGVIVGPTDTVRPAHFKPRQKWAVAGASFEESTIVDSSASAMSSWGYPSLLGRMLGVEVVTCAKGGTGFLNPGPGVKMHDRLADLTGLAPDVVLWGGSLPMNDQSYGSYSQSGQAAQIAACLDDVQTALPSALQIVLGPFWPRGRLTYPSRIFEIRDTLKAAADARGLTFIEMLAPPPAAASLVPAATTLSADTAVGASTITVPGNLMASTAFQQIIGQTIVQIGTGNKAEVRAIQSRSGSAGAWVYNVNEAGNPLVNAHTAGEAVKVVANGFVTGSGTQTSPSGSGNADLFVGSDSTHPTGLGHENLANYIYARLMLLLDN